MPQSALFAVSCDILVPAARPDCIHIDNAREIQAKLILQGANIPATIEAESILQERGIGAPIPTPHLKFGYPAHRTNNNLTNSKRQEWFMKAVNEISEGQPRLTLLAMFEHQLL